MVVVIGKMMIGVSNLLPFTAGLRSVDLSVVPGRLRGKIMVNHGFLAFLQYFQTNPPDEVLVLVGLFVASHHFGTGKVPHQSHQTA